MSKICAMIPARMGSTRLKHKNIRLLHNKPLIWYGIDAAKKSGVFDGIYLNTDWQELESYANECNINFYKRDAEHASSIATADDVIYDFFKHVDCDYLFWINTTNPFQPYGEYQKALKYFLDNNLDGLITTTCEKIHTRFNGSPLNYKCNERLPKTQDLEPIEIFAFPFSIWKRETFVKNYENEGFAYLCGNIGYWKVDKIAALEIDDEEDFIIANSILYGKENPLVLEKRYLEF